MNSQPPQISVIVLCYKSAATIRGFVQSLMVSLTPVEPDWELVLVGNYFADTGDETPAVVRDIAAANPRIRAVTLVKEGMMGWDMRSGLAAATGRTLAVIDGDGQMPPEDIAAVYKKLRAENLDLVKTYRVQRDDGAYRRIISGVYNFVFRVLFPGLPCEDINSKPKIMTREVYDRMNLESDDWFIDAEIMILARRLKLRVGEIPTVFHNMHARPSFVKPSSILEFLANLFRYRVRELGMLFKRRE